MKEEYNIRMQKKAVLEKREKERAEKEIAAEVARQKQRD
jgi:hypothetical protein